jgi:hypothetical protein
MYGNQRHKMPKGIARKVTIRKKNSFMYFGLTKIENK